MRVTRIWFSGTLLFASNVMLYWAYTGVASHLLPLAGQHYIEAGWRHATTCAYTLPHMCGGFWM